MVRAQGSVSNHPPSESWRVLRSCLLCAILDQKFTREPVQVENEDRCGGADRGRGVWGFARARDQL